VDPQAIVRLAVLIRFWIGVALLARFIRHRIRCARAARNGWYPPDPTPIWIAPLITFGILGCLAVPAAILLAGHRTPQQQLSRQLDRQQALQVKLGKELQRPPARSYLELDTSAATLRDLGDEARDVQAEVRALDRTRYDRNELAMIAALDAMLAADIAYMDGFRQLVAQRKAQITPNGAALPPDAQAVMLERRIALNTRALAMVDPYVALRAITPAEGAREKAQLQAGIARLQQLALPKPKAAKPKAAAKPATKAAS
jgi:hypothetical protein